MISCQEKVIRGKKLRFIFLRKERIPMRQILGGVLLMMGAAGAVFAGITAPEIDPASGAAALALLAGGLVVLRGRRKK